MVPRIPRIALLPILAALVVFASACSNKKDPPIPPEDDLTQEEADDVALMFASAAATDSGGWLTVPLSTFARAPRDSTFRRGLVDWTLDCTYYDADSLPPLQAYDSTVVSLGCVTASLGRIPLAGGAGGGLWAQAGDLSVSGLAGDTVSFGGFARVDSALITITSGGAHPNYYFDNVVEYTFDMSRNPPSAYPVAGEALIDGFVDIHLTPSRLGEREGQLEVLMVITFDGTETPLATVAHNVPDPGITYRYRVNLKTGAVVRAP